MAVTHVGANTLGNLLKIVSKGGVINNLSEDSAIWQNILKQHVSGDALGRQLRYAIRTNLGSAAAGFLTVTGGAFLSGQAATVSEGIAEWKDFGCTVEVDRTVIEKALQDFDSYGKPLVEELDLKSIALARILSAAVYGDGTGVIAQALNAGTIVAGSTVFAISAADTAKGFAGWIEENDIIHIIDPDTTDTTPTLSAGTYSHYVVTSVDRDANTVTLRAKTTTGTDLTVTATNIAAGDYMVRGKTADTYQDISALSTTVDYNTASTAFTGLDALTQDTNILVNAIQLTGNAGGTRQDESGNPIDSQAFQKLMSKLMRRAGKGRYKYDQACMAWETYDSLIESRETDRRFMSIEDDKRGVRGMAYIHGKNAVMFDPDEFCPKKRIYVIPNQGALQFHGSDFDFVSPNGSDKFAFRPTGTTAGYDRVVQSFMEGSGALITTHAAALGCIHNFV